MSEKNSAFYKMLAWLDPDPDLAGQTYNEIQRKLIGTFACRGCSYPEYEILAQKTIELVTEKFEDPSSQFSENYAGAPIAYFYGVARFVYLKYMRDKKAAHQHIQNHIELLQPDGEKNCLGEYRHLCLEECLKQEKHEDKILLFQYYQEDNRRKINQRLKLAGEQKEKLNSLRIRVCRIRKRLRECIGACVDRRSKAAS